MSIRRRSNRPFSAFDYSQRGGVLVANATNPDNWRKGGRIGARSHETAIL